jgi:hypothetical protein
MKMGNIHTQKRTYERVSEGAERRRRSGVLYTRIRGYGEEKERERA